VGHVELAGIDVVLPDGRPLLVDVSFRVGDGQHAALVGPNGAGKTTLLRLVAGELTPVTGAVTRSGGIGVMRQFIGSVRGDSTVTDLLLTAAPDRLRTAAAALEAAELAMIEVDDEASQLTYAQALADFGDAGGYDAEVGWDECTRTALGIAYDSCRYRKASTLSGGEQKRLVLEALLAGSAEVLLLDEPDNYLDVPGKRWLEERLRATPKTVLLVSHDRELLARVADRIVAVELGHGNAGNTVWVHGGGFATWHSAREDRFTRLEELRRRWDEEHVKLRELMFMYRQKAAYNSDMAARYKAAVTRLERFEQAGPPQEIPRRQDIRMRLAGGRTGLRSLTCSHLELTGLMKPFDAEVFYGERVGILGSNGSGKSHFLRLLGGEPVAHTGAVKLGARVVPGLFAQTHDHAALDGRTLLEILWSDHSLRIEDAAPSLDRYDLAHARDQRFETLSGGQQARLQILLLELSGVTMLLLDEPTDNLDLASAEALEVGLAGFAGTVLAVTHDRWFARSLDRFLVFGADGVVRTADEPVWDETRVARAR
jgi:ATPase subunit of ABC transporter with duplicated ATPase domains